VNREIEAIKKGLSANYEGPDVLEDMSFSPLMAITSPGLATLWALPFMGFVSSALIRLFTRTSPEKIATRRRRRACGRAVGELTKLAHTTDTDKTNEQLATIMKHYIGERFDKTAGSLTPNDCYEAIAAATNNTNTADKYKEAVTALEAGRYAPMEINVDAKKVNEVISLIRAIEKDCRK